MHRIEGSISNLFKTLALPCKKMNRTRWGIRRHKLDTTNKKRVYSYKSAKTLLSIPSLIGST